MYSQFDNLLMELVGMFHSSLDALGEFLAAAPQAMPQTYRRLLDHHEHMTVTVEAYHGSPVDVLVLHKQHKAQHYAREILLKTQSSGRIVQYGIMRVNLSYIDQTVQKEILEERTPLGRVLIQHNVMREVQCLQLWQIRCGPQLAQHFEVAPHTVTFGRTARIVCNGEPAVALLEIVAPCTD